MPKSLVPQLPYSFLIRFTVRLVRAAETEVTFCESLSRMLMDGACIQVCGSSKVQPGMGFPRKRKKGKAAPVPATGCVYTLKSQGFA